MRRLIAHDLHVEIADLRVAEHSGERLGVRGGRDQVPQALLLVLVAGHDEGLALAAHQLAPGPECRVTNSEMSRSWSAADACESSRASPSSSSRPVRRAPPPRPAQAVTAATTDRRPSADWPSMTSNPLTWAAPKARLPGGGAFPGSAVTSSTSNCRSSERR